MRLNLTRNLDPAAVRGPYRRNHSLASPATAERIEVSVQRDISSQNIENNPMQSSEVVAGIDVLPNDKTFDASGK